MHIDILIWVALSITCVCIAALWLKIVAVCGSSVRLKATLDKLIYKLPKTLSSKVITTAQQAVPEQTPAAWLLHQLIVAMSVFIILSLPISAVVKLTIGVSLLLMVLARRNRLKAYQRKVIRQWPSALDLVAMLMQSGLSLRAALHALQSIPNNLSAVAEIARLHRLQQSGYSLSQAIDALSLRITHPWISLFAGAVLQAQETGGALANTLKSQANQFRQQQLLEAEKRAQEVSVKLMLPLIFCFFPVTMLLILGPVFIGFTQGGIL